MKSLILFLANNCQIKFAADHIWKDGSVSSEYCFCGNKKAGNSISMPYLQQKDCCESCATGPPNLDVQSKCQMYH